MIEDIGSLSNQGRRLLPNVVDELGAGDPSRIFVSIPKSTNIQDGFRDVDFRDLSRAISRCAWWIEETLGCSRSFETLNYVGPQDLRYVILLFAAIKTGYQVCPSAMIGNSLLLTLIKDVLQFSMEQRRGTRRALRKVEL